MIKKLLNLYNAVNGTHYNNPEEVTINTIDNVIYMTMKNDGVMRMVERMDVKNAYMYL